MQTLRERIATNGYVLNGYCQMPSPAAAEIYCRQGWDVVTLDLEHGAMGFDAAVRMLEVMAAAPVLPFIRIPGFDPRLIAPLLDAGVMGVTCAMVNTADEARALVRACRYPPKGVRSMSRMSRASLVYGPDYVSRANDTVTVFAMVESPEGLANVREIAAVEGLDGIYMGPVDLAMAVVGRVPPLGGRDPEIEAVVDDAMSRVVAACNQAGAIAGINAPNPEEALRMLNRGFRFITLSSDVRALAVQSRAWVDGLRKLAPVPHRPAGA